jgi:DNA-binding CsgD family transcriptional regulator
MAQENHLSNREQEVVTLLLQGKSNKQIATSLSLSESTVEFHLKNIYTKYNVRSRVELILKLGNTTGRLETEKLGRSTVDGQAEETDYRDRLNVSDWPTTETVSTIGKENIVQSSINSAARGSGTTMTFAESIRSCLTKYAEFQGRASRSEFWWFTLFVTLAAAALAYISMTVSNAFLVAMLLPLLAAGTRRLHDSGRSGWWQLFLLVPVAGLVLQAILWTLPPTSSASMSRSDES